MAKQPLTIPLGFPELLKGFTREVLRAQPASIYEFGAQYFQNLLENGSNGKANIKSASQRAASLRRVQETAAALDIAHLSPGELEPVILQLFLEADADHSGYLDRSELAKVLKSAQLNLSDRQVRQVLAEADEDEDGVVQYREFLPLMVDVLQAIKACEGAAAVRADADAQATAEVEGVLLHGMPREELEVMMMRVFKKADVDGSGQLSRAEFKLALRAAQLGLTRREINALLSAVDCDANGMVSYEEFMPLCFQILVERFKEEVLTGQVVRSGGQEGVHYLLLEHLQAADPDGTGLLSQAKVKEVLKQLSFQELGLSTLQLAALMGQAPTTPQGDVQYLHFVPAAAAMIHSMYDADAMKLRMQAIKQVSSVGGVAGLGRMDTAALRSALEAAFVAADSAATGRLQAPQVMELLQHLCSSGEVEQLSDAHARAIFAAIDVDESGDVDWYELVNFICDTIEHLEREAYIQQVSTGEASMWTVGGEEEAEQA